MPDITFPGAWLEVPTPAPAPRRWSARSSSRWKRPSTAWPASSASPRAAIEGRAAGQHRVRPRCRHGACDAGGARPRGRCAEQPFPKDAKAPTVARWNNDNSQPVVQCLALLSKTRSARELSILGEQNVGKRLQRVEGVARVEISGLTVREVRIDLDPTAPARLRRHAGRDCHRAEGSQRRPAGGPAERHPCRTLCCAWKAACATRSSSSSWWWRAAAAWR